MNSSSRRLVGINQIRGTRLCGEAMLEGAPRIDQQRANPWRSVLTACSTLLFTLALAQPVKASFVGIYALSNFTLTNVDDTALANTHGSAISLDGGLTVTFTGGNSGSGLGGFTDLLIHAAAAGLVQFQYSYSSKDDEGFDLAGYVLGGSFTELTEKDNVCGLGTCPANVSFPVSLGQSFGFRIRTLDNENEPGVLTISDFSAPTGAVPEPNAIPLMVLLLTAAKARQSWMRWRKSR